MWVLHFWYPIISHWYYILSVTWRTDKGNAIMHIVDHIFFIIFRDNNALHQYNIMTWREGRNGRRCLSVPRINGLFWKYSFHVVHCVSSKLLLVLFDILYVAHNFHGTGKATSWPYPYVFVPHIPHMAQKHKVPAISLFVCLLFFSSFCGLTSYAWR